MEPRSDSWKRIVLCWSAAGVIVLVYAAHYARVVIAHTAIPYFDQTNYMYRIFYMHDVWKRARHVLDYFDIFGGEFSGRPPLMMIPPALLWGDRAHPQPVALLWLGIRMAVLLLAMFLLARLCGTARFVPAALFTILGSEFFLAAQPHLYLMDQAFAVFGLLTFALVARDLTRPSAASATGAAVGALLFVLVKPAAASFLFPMFSVVAVRGALRLVGVFRRGHGGWDWLRWAAPLVVMLVILLLLWKSPYGRAVAAQYDLGSRGYWTRPVSVIDALEFATVIIPPWLLALAVLRLIRSRQLDISGWVVACVIAAAGWWYVFNAFLAYVADPRVLAGILCVTVTAAFVIVSHDSRLMAVATTIAAVLFVTNLAAATGARGALQALVGPLATPQEPVAEVGLLPFVQGVQTAIHKIHPPTERVSVITAVNDEFVEFAALNLAMRYVNGDAWSPIRFEPLPWGSMDFDLTRLLGAHWFVTKQTRRALALRGDVWVSLYAMDDLITNPASPLRGRFVKRLETPVRQPEFGDSGLLAPRPPRRTIEQTLTLWYLPTAPPLVEQAMALRWLEPKFRDTPGHAAFGARLERMETMVARGNSLTTIDAISARQIVTAAHPALRNIAFDADFRLLGLVKRRSAGGIDLELAWESLRDQALDCIVFVHLLDTKQAIIGQLDYAQDPFKAPVTRGTVWRDVIRIPDAQLARVNTIGIGLLRLPSHLLRTDHGVTDWDGRRLTIAVE